MTEKLRVLHLISNLGFAGAGTNIAPFLRFSDSSFFDTILGVFHESEPRRARAINEEGTKIEVFHGDIGAYFDFLKKEEIDVLHFSRAGNEESHLIPSNVPIRIELNIFGLKDGRPESTLIDRHLLQSKTTALRYLAQAGLNLEQFLSTNRVQYLPTDINKFDQYRPSEDRHRKIKQELDIEFETPVICRVGRVDLWKWSFFILHAFSLVVERYPNVKFLIIGGVSEAVLSKIRKWRLEKYFRILPEVSDDYLIELLHVVDVVAHSSHIGESFGAAIAQAMAAKKPVVVNSTDWADNAQVELVDHGITGVVANTPKKHADSVIHLLRDKKIAQEMGYNGYLKALSQFSAPNATRTLEKSYAEVADLKGIKPNRERSKFYGEIACSPSLDEIRSWPREYSEKLAESGYCFNAFTKSLLRKAWEATNILPALRQFQFPRFVLESDGILGYLPAVT